MSVVTACILEAALGTVPAAQAANGDRNAIQVESAPVGFGIYGPYATIRRANEVANYFCCLGYSALVFQNGDGYYVRAW